MPTTKYFPKFKESLPSVEGKVFVITGTTSGTGFVAAQTAAEKGAEVLLLNRKSQRMTDSYAKLQVAVPAGKFVNIECDLQDFASVQRAGEEICSKYEQVYCLANNAGIMMTPDQATKDGCDTQMQTNHLSHFILTKALLPLVEAEAKSGGDARIVFHSSAARELTKNGGLEKQYFEKNGGDLGGDLPKSFFGPAMRRYAQTKLANSVMAYAMHEKLQAKGSKIRVTACHPGSSITNLADNHDIRWLEAFFLKSISSSQSAEDGTMGLLIGMMATDAESGVLYGPKNGGMFGPGMTGLAVPNTPQPYERDPAAMKMLWETSEETTGVKFEI